MKITKLNKKIFVIGGSGAIGSQVCKDFSGAGSKVFNIDLKFKKRNNKIKNIFLDIGNVKKLEFEINKIINLHGVPDVLVNCSYPKTSDWGNNSFKNISLNSFQKNIDIHLNSFVWSAKIIANKMIKRKKGSIIFLSSIYGLVGQDLEIYKNTKMKESLTYSVIKGGLISLTKQMASYYGRYNIRINSISPGGIKEKKHPSIFIKKYIKKVPLKRFCTPKDVSGATLFLASDLSSYITGTTLKVDGGWTAI